MLATVSPFLYFWITRDFPTRTRIHSHARLEDDELTRWLCGRLTSHGYRVWADLEQLLGGCGEVARNLGKHVTKSEHSTEERELVRELPRDFLRSPSAEGTDIRPPQ